MQTGERSASGRVDQKALEDIAFLRDTMSKASTFRQVPGIGMMLMGVIALVGGYIAAQQTTPDWSINVWGITGFIGWAVGAVAMTWKSQRSGVNWWRGPGRHAVAAFSPAIFVGLFLTEVLFERSNNELLPGIWLMLYGVGVFGAAPFTVAPIRGLGAAFILLGTAYFVWLLQGSPFSIGSYSAADCFLAVGFGGFHIVAGAIIALRHGG